MNKKNYFKKIKVINESKSNQKSNLKEAVVALHKVRV